MKLYIAEHPSDIEDMVLDLIDEVTAKKMVVGVDPLIDKSIIDYLNNDERVVDLLSLSNEKEVNAKKPTEAMFKDFDLIIMYLKENGLLLYNKANASFGNIMLIDDDKVSIGLKKISQAKRCILIAKGVKMAQTVFDLVNQSKSEGFPASIILDMDNAILICDKDASNMI